MHAQVPQQRGKLCCDFNRGATPGQEKRVDKATLEMEPEYPAKYFDDLAADLCASERTFCLSIVYAHRLLRLSHEVTRGSSQTCKRRICDRWLYFERSVLSSRRTVQTPLCV